MMLNMMNLGKRIYTFIFIIRTNRTKFWITIDKYWSISLHQLSLLYVSAIQDQLGQLYRQWSSIPFLKWDSVCTILNIVLNTSLYMLTVMSKYQTFKCIYSPGASLCLQMLELMGTKKVTTSHAKVIYSSGEIF